MNFDIISWVKDGAGVLPRTLKRLERVLPSECVHRKIMVDDHSQDETVSIGKDFNWKVYDNPKTGIFSGANYALSKVDCPFFMSFEQDLFLARDWWQKISPLLSRENVVAASGVRWMVTSLPLFALDFYIHNRVVKSKETHYASQAFRYGKYLDNTLWRTDIVRELGGFPKMRCNTGIDTVLSYQIYARGLEWLVDKTVISTHLRSGGVREYLKHTMWYSSGYKEIRDKVRKLTGLELPSEFRAILRPFLTSPIRALDIALKTREPMLVMIYPVQRLLDYISYLKGYSP